MDLEVVGRHALLFDDDTNAEFVNSQEALVEWNSLLIDRYDVRHLLSIPLPPLKRRLRSSSPSSVESEIDEERYLDLPPSDDNQDDDETSAFPESNNGAERATGGIYNAVAFSYGNSTDQKDLDTGSGESGFVPPFPVPDSLLQNLPPTEKLHQIMARTAIFVSKHGGQSEIVLRVKQGDNPTFGFLMPDHHLHAYFRFLVDHPEVVKSDMDGKLQNEDKKADNEQNHMANSSSGALSLLGSAYESGEDEDGDGSPQDVNESADKKTGDSTNGSDATHSQPEQAGMSLCSTEKDEGTHKHSLAAAKEKILSVKRNRSVTGVTTSNKCSKKMESDALGSILTTAHKPQTSIPPGISKIEPLIFEPPSEVKRTMDKIVEFILRNGKQFEAVLIEQDAKNGRFPFLLPSNRYHSYYLRVLEKAQELKQAGKSFDSQKPGIAAPVGGKKGASAKDNDTPSELPGSSHDKEKFKMVISGLKKDAQEPVSKPAQQCGVSVDAAAAIIQAARRGIRNPNLDILPSKSLDESSIGLSGEGVTNPSFGSLPLTSRARSSTPKLVSGVGVGEPSNMVAGKTSFASVAKAIAKTAALAAAAEADSSEACLTKEQKQKAERLKRAKMFAAMLKGGVAPIVNAASPSLSAEPPDSAYSVLQISAQRASSLNGPTQSPDTANSLGDEVEDLAGREREGSSVPVDIDTSGKVEDFKKRDSEDDDYKEKRTRMKHHLRSRRHLEDEDDDDDDRDHRHSRRKHRSRHSSHKDRDDRSHRKRHSSSKDRESRHRHRHHSSSEDEHHHRSRSEKHRRRSHKERKVESEDEEIDAKRSKHLNSVRISDSASRGASVDLLDDRREKSSSLVPDAQPTGTTEVSDDLRAKVRAMLLATM